jgi:hypothetical protein
MDLDERSMECSCWIMEKTREKAMEELTGKAEVSEDTCMPRTSLD